MKKLLTLGGIKTKLGRSETFWGYLFLTPTLIGLAVFSAGAVLATLGLSFCRWTILTPPTWGGLVNYDTAIHDPVFITALVNTFWFTIGSVPLNLVFSLFFALLLNNKIKGVTIYRTIYFMPVISSIVAVSLLWSWLYDPRYGLINYLLHTLFGLNGPPWLSDTDWAMPAVIIMSVWRNLGYSIVIFLAGLQGIATEYYESAEIDGANWYQKIKQITLPLLTPTTFFILITSIISSFQVFEQTYVLTRGGPANSTMTLVYYLFLNAFHWFKMGYASAIGVICFIIVLIVTLFQLRYQKKWVHYQ